MLFIPLLLFIFGLIIGSFLNVVILRLGTGRSMVHGRSMCMRCSNALAWHELIPVFSFLFRKGKCRSCRAPISFQYPIVELTTAVLFVILYMKIVLVGGFTAFSWLSFSFSLVVASLLIVMAIYDARHKIIPDAVVYPFILLGLIAIVVKGAVLPGFALIPALLAGPLVGLPFFLLWAFSKGKAMGFGDVKLALGMGWLLGLSKGLAAVILSFWVGAIFGLFLIALSRRHGMKSEVPFAPFLILGTLIAGVWGITFGHIFPLL